MQGDDTSAGSRAVAALSGVAETAGLSTKESADAVAEVVNAMVVRWAWIFTSYIWSFHKPCNCRSKSSENKLTSFV